jgi:hypothetical protein
MRRILQTLFFIILFSSSALFSQTQVEKAIDKEPMTGQESVSPVIALKSTIPCNFFNNISSAFIGISDIGVDSATARQQAYLRALSMVTLRKGLAIGMSDFFNDSNGEETSSNYEELCELKAKCNLPVEGLKVSDSIWLKSGELVLFLKVDTTTVKYAERINIESSASIYYKESETDGSLKEINKITQENNFFYPCRENGHTEKLTYNTCNNRWLSKETFFDDRKIDSDQYKIFYEPQGECNIDSTGCKESGSGSIDGLWFALVNNIYRQLTAQLKEHFVKLKKVGDMYQDKMITLNRETGYFNFGCKLIDGALVDNKLFIRIKTEFPTPTR